MIGELEKGGKTTLENEIRYDMEKDIGRYLEYLTVGCSQDIGNSPKGVERFQKRCLDALKSIVYEPRCTARYDSRINCNGTAVPTDNISTVLPPPGELVRDHFGKESLNVVIVGGGPIGLLFANALSMLPKRQQQQGEIPPIRILILESRADKPGVKRAYSRNWQAHLNLVHFRHLVDPRVLKLFASMTYDRENYDESTEEFVLPLNVIETILLLSNRDMGATKFLFGIDPLELVDDLKDVQNLVLVDSTGHRLEPLRRGSICDGFGEEIDEDCEAQRKDDPKSIFYNYRTPAVQNISWLNEENADFYNHLKTFTMDFLEEHDFLEDNGFSLNVAQSGDILYPIDEETKTPKTIHWLDIHGATLTSEQSRQEGDREKENLYSSNGAFCDYCKKFYDLSIEEGYGYEFEGEYHFDFIDPDNQRVDEICTYMCYSDYFTSSIDLLRDDIQRAIINGRFNDTFVYQGDGWFPIMGYAFNPSTELAHQIEIVLENHGYRNDPIGMPLRQLYPALESSIETTKLSEADLDLVKALKRITRNFNTSDWPAATLAAQLPFIYTNGFKRKNKCNKKNTLGDQLEDVPMIRIGDSFTTGDGVAGAGLYTHATMIGVFMDIILDKSRVSSSTSSS